MVAQGRKAMPDITLVKNLFYSFENLLDELQMTYQEAYEEKFVYDDLIDLVVQKRINELTER